MEINTEDLVVDINLSRQEDDFDLDSKNDENLDEDMEDIILFVFLEKTGSIECQGRLS